jgi:hypothetical protein
MAGGGTKAINAALDNQGTLTVVAGGAGVLNLTGNFSTSGIVNLELGGTTAGSGYDQIAVTGTATLAGTLNVSLINGFTPTTGQTFTLISSTGARSGRFGAETIPAGTTTNYNANSVTLTAP